MDTTISSDNLTAEVTDNQDGPVTGSETAQPAGQADGQSSPGEEVFKGVDPTKLPPELRSHYDNMLRDYRSKTEKLSETVKTQVAKETDGFRQKADWYDSALKDPGMVKVINDYVKQLNESAKQKEAADGLPPEIRQKLEKVDRIEQELNRTKANEVITAFQEAVNEKGEKLHPNFEKYSGIGMGSHPERGDFNLLRVAVELASGNSTQEKLLNGYKLAEATYNQIFEEGKKAGMGRVQDKVRNGTHPPSSLNAASTAPRRPKDALEALDFAKRGFEPHG